MRKKPTPDLGMPTCKLCGRMQQTEETGPFVKHGPIHYAHMACFVAANKPQRLLTVKQRRELQRWLSKRGKG